MKSGIQSILKAVGMYGCLFLCYEWSGDRTIEQLPEDYNRLVESGALGRDCFVKSHAQLRDIIKPKKGNYRIVELNHGDHFVIVDKNNYLLFDPSGVRTLGKEPKDITRVVYEG